MQIDNFNDLTNFLYVEYEKMTESFNIIKPSTDFISFFEKSLKKYYKLYDKPLMKRARNELKLQMALESMPHGKVWQFFHPTLWAKIKLLEKEKEKFEQSEEVSSEPAKTLVPTVVKPVEPPRLSEIGKHEVVKG